MTLGMEGSGLAQVGMEMIEIQNQLAASGKERDCSLICPGPQNSVLFRPLSPFILKPKGWPGGMARPLLRGRAGWKEAFDLRKDVRGW